MCGAKEVETWEKKKDGDDQRDFGVGVLVSVMVEWKKGMRCKRAAGLQPRSTMRSLNALLAALLSEI